MTYKTSSESGIRFLVSPGLRIVMIFLAWILGTVMMMFLSFILGKIMTNNQTALLRISTVFQDILMWIVPAVITALVVTRQSARLLALDRLPSLRQTVLAVLLLIVSSPFMSWIIELNANFHFPTGWEAVEEALRAMEDSAASTVTTIMGSKTPGNLIVNILIIGIFAGFSEELFFRGGVQRILATSNLSPHVAIWSTALIFSALHFQFFGFVPRLMLGAAFGYLLFWSGSVWLPMLIHTLNNTAYVLFYSFTGSGEPDFGSAGSSWFAVVLSVILTAATLAALSRTKLRSSIADRNYHNDIKETSENIN